jgi:hypothetical protein
MVRTTLRHVAVILFVRTGPRRNLVARTIDFCISGWTRLSLSTTDRLGSSSSPCTTLHAAQTGISQNWETLYKTVFGITP